MKKLFGLILIVLFIFSVLPANAGPALERLRHDSRYAGLYLVKSFHGIASMETLRTTAFQMTVMNSIRLRFRRSVAGFVTMEFVMTKAEHVFSDESFRDTIRKSRVLYQVLSFRTLHDLFLRKNEQADRMLKMQEDDLRSKGLTDGEVDLCITKRIDIIRIN